MVTQKKVQQNFDLSFLNTNIAETPVQTKNTANVKDDIKRKHAPKSDEKQVLVNFYMSESEKQFYKDFFKKDNRTLSGGIHEALKSYYELNKDRVER